MSPPNIPFDGGATPLDLAAFIGMAGIVVWHAIPGRRTITRLIVQIPNASEPKRL